MHMALELAIPSRGQFCGSANEAEAAILASSDITDEFFRGEGFTKSRA